MSYPHTRFVPTNDAQLQAVLKLAHDWPSLATSSSARDQHLTSTPISPAVAVCTGTSTPSLELVRSKLTALAREGKSDQVKQLLEKYNAKSLTQLDPQHFTAVLAEAGGL